jgi:predicted MFS family arabinose efflux permease
MTTQIRDGLRFVRRHPYLWPIVVSASVSNLFNAIFGAVILLFAVRELRLDAPTIGVILALGNLGILAGALLSRRIGARLGVGRAIVVMAVVSGAGVMLFPLATILPPIPISILGLFIATFGGTVFNVNQLTLRQAVTPPEMLGRMNATVRFVAWGSLPVGGLAGGVLGTVIGVPATLWVGAIGCALAFVPILWSPVARVRDIPGEPTSAAGVGAAMAEEPTLDPLRTV